MKPAMKRDLVDISDIMENLSSKLTSLSQADLIDLAARLKPIAKHCDAIDKYVKDEIVKVELGEMPGELMGGEFKAILKVVSTTRLNQKLLKDMEPKIHAKYNEPCDDLRVSFELR